MRGGEELGQRRRRPAPRQLRIRQDARLRNEFRLVLTDARTGAVKQQAWAYNTILDRGFDRLLDNLRLATDNNVSSYQLFRRTTAESHRRFGGSILLGTGTGTITPDRTAMFNRLTGKVADGLHDKGYDFGELTAYRTLYGVWTETSIQNQDITEIGMGSSTGDADLTTHALITDSAGNPITVSKGEWDILTVYATCYIELQPHGYGSNLGYVEGASSSNFLLRWISESLKPYASNQFRVNLGRNNDPISSSDPAVKTTVRLQTIGRSFNHAQKRIELSTRIGASSGNHADGIWEIGLWVYSHQSEDGGYTGNLPVFRSVLPLPGVWDGYEGWVDEHTGDGEQTEYMTTWSPIRPATLIVKVDGVVQTAGAEGDYTVDLETGTVTFSSAPGDGLPIELEYDIDQIPKDENHVLDIAFILQFADAGA